MFLTSFSLVMRYLIMQMMKMKQQMTVKPVKQPLVSTFV